MFYTATLNSIQVLGKLKTLLFSSRGNPNSGQPVTWRTFFALWETNFGYPNDPNNFSYGLPIKRFLAILDNPRPT